MDRLKNSLCETCGHFEYCNLTHDKNTIWSCCDYEASGTNGVIQQ